MSGRHGVEGLLLHPPQLQQPDVVVAGDEQRIVGGGLQVDGELAVVRHPAVQAAGELEDDGLQTGVLFDVPHFDDLRKTKQLKSVLWKVEVLLFLSVTVLIIQYSSSHTSVFVNMHIEYLVWNLLSTRMGR